MFFWNCLAFFMIQQILAILSLVPLPFLNPAWTPGSSRFMYYCRLAWRILSITCESVRWVHCTIVWRFFGISFLWDCSEYWPIPVLWPLLSFLNLLAYWVQHFRAWSFKIWNSSAGIPLPPVALFVVMLPKAHLTLDTRMSGSRWVITPSWLSGSWRSFLCSSSVYSCHLYAIHKNKLKMT